MVLLIGVLLFLCSSALAGSVFGVSELPVSPLVTEKRFFEIELLSFRDFSTDEVASPDGSSVSVNSRPNGSISIGFDPSPDWHWKLQGTFLDSFRTHFYALTLQHDFMRDAESKMGWIARAGVTTLSSLGSETKSSPSFAFGGLYSRKFVHEPSSIGAFDLTGFFIVPLIFRSRSIFGGTFLCVNECTFTTGNQVFTEELALRPEAALDIDYLGIGIRIGVGYDWLLNSRVTYSSHSPSGWRYLSEGFVRTDLVIRLKVGDTDQ